jgi:ribulose-bisphosphate carboxylase large chain
MIVMSSDRVVARYLVESPLPLEQAAEVLAGEQSSGTFVAVPGETEELRQQFRARVERVELLETVTTPSLPGSRSKSIAMPARYQRGEVTVSWPVHNFGTNLPTLVSTLQGNLYELAQFSGLRLRDFDVPDSFRLAFRGPRFGIAGTRRLTGVARGVMVGTIIKPSVGLSPAQTAELVRTLAEAGIDFIKDDELMANPPHSPFERRVEAVMRVLREHAQRTGKLVMYAFNCSDELDAMLRHYDTIIEHGGSSAMVSLNTVGLAAVKKLCDRGELPVHGHRNGWGMLTRYPMLGMDFAAYQKIWRLAGVDQIHVNGLGNKFYESDDSVVRSIQACRTPLLGGMEILPVVSSGQWGGQAPETYRRTGTTDLLYLAGGGIAAHPSGPAAGVRALRQAWEAAERGIDLNDFARDHDELRQSIEKFGAGSGA